MTEPVFSAAVALARDGDGPAFERLYRWLAPDVTRFAAIRDAEDPQGLTNTVFRRAFRQIQRFDSTQESFRAWIFAIARSQLVAAKQVNPHLPSDASDTAPERSGDGTRLEALDLLSLQRVTRLLSRLGDDERDVILLRMVGRLSLQQVSIIVDKPVPIIATLQREGLRRLQDELLAEVISR